MKKEKYCMSSFICGISVIKLIEAESTQWLPGLCGGGNGELVKGYKV